MSSYILLEGTPQQHNWFMVLTSASFSTLYWDWHVHREHAHIWFSRTASSSLPKSPGGYQTLTAHHNHKNTCNFQCNWENVVIYKHIHPFFLLLTSEHMSLSLWHLCFFFSSSYYILSALSSLVISSLPQTLLYVFTHHH